MCLVKIQAIVFMVARHKQHGRGPAMQGRKPLQTKIGLAQHGALLVRPNVARQHQQVGPGGGRRRKVRVRLQVKVREQL